MTKKIETTKNSTDENKGNKGTENTEFEKSFGSSHAPLENKSILNIVNNFSLSFGEQISKYLGKNIEVEFNSMEHVETKPAIQEAKKVVFSSFSIANQAEIGLILLDYQALDAFIDFLFGYDGEREVKRELHFGKCSLNIAQEIAQLSLNSLEQLMSEYLAFKPTLLKSITGLKDINFHRIADKSYQIVFKITARKWMQSINLLIPQSLIEQIIYNDNPKENNIYVNVNDMASNNLKNEVVDSTVRLVAVLPEIKLKFNDVLNLKSGDLISIGDPTQVELRVDNKKLYKAHIGQVDSYRVVKTIAAFS